MSETPCVLCCTRQFEVFRRCINCQACYLKHLELEITSSSSDDSETERFMKATAQPPRKRTVKAREQGPWKLFKPKFKAPKVNHLKIDKATKERIQKLSANDIEINFRPLRVPGASCDLTAHEKEVLTATEKCLEGDPACSQSLEIDAIEEDAANPS